MKKILLYFIIALPIMASAQIKDTIGLNVPMKDGQLIYEGVIDMQGKKQADLYRNAKQWFVDYFVSSRDVIQNEDKDNGKIVGKGVVTVYYKQLMTLELKSKLTIQIDCRDGKYRYKIYDITLSPTAGSTYVAEGFVNNLTGSKPDNSFSKGQSKKILGGLVVEVDKAIASIKTAMIKKTDDF